MNTEINQSHNRHGCPDPDSLLKETAGEDEILAVLPCRVADAKAGPFDLGKKYGFGFATVVSFFVIPYWLFPIPVIMLLIFLAWVSKDLRLWWQGYRTKPEALVITPSKLIFACGVILKLPENMHSAKEIITVPFSDLKSHRTPLMDADNSFNAAGKIRFETTNGEKLEAAPVGLVLNLNSRYTGFYKDKVVSFNQAKALLKDLLGR